MINAHKATAVPNAASTMSVQRERRSIIVRLPGFVPTLNPPGRLQARRKVVLPTGCWRGPGADDLKEQQWGQRYDRQKKSPWGRRMEGCEQVDVSASDQLCGLNS